MNGDGYYWAKYIMDDDAAPWEVVEVRSGLVYQCGSDVTFSFLEFKLHPHKLEAPK